MDIGKGYYNLNILGNISLWFKSFGMPLIRRKTLKDVWVENDEWKTEIYKKEIKISFAICHKVLTLSKLIVIVIDVRMKIFMWKMKVT